MLADRIPEAFRGILGRCEQALRIPLDRHQRAGAVIVSERGIAGSPEDRSPRGHPTDEALWTSRPSSSRSAAAGPSEIVVVFADGVVRKRIDTHATRARAELSANLICAPPSAISVDPSTAR